MSIPQSAPTEPRTVPTAPRAWEVVVEWVQERILSGEFVVGSTIPAERDLAAKLGVSRSAVREAVRTLQASGVLTSTVGAGLAGGTTVTTVPHRALSQLVRLHEALGSFTAHDVTQVRVALERVSAARASIDATDEELAMMRAPLERMDDDTLSMAMFNQLDTDFHVAIANSGGNRLARDMTVAIRESMAEPILAGLRSAPRWPDMRAMLRREHHAIMDAISQGKAHEAADLVEQHIWAAYERMPSLH